MSVKPTAVAYKSITKLRTPFLAGTTILLLDININSIACRKKKPPQQRHHRRHQHQYGDLYAHNCISISMNNASENHVDGHRCGGVTTLDATSSRRQHRRCSRLAYTREFIILAAAWLNLRVTCFVHVFRGRAYNIQYTVMCMMCVCVCMQGASMYYIMLFYFALCACPPRIVYNSIIPAVLSACHASAHCCHRPRILFSCKLPTAMSCHYAFGIDDDLVIAIQNVCARASVVKYRHSNFRYVFSCSYRRS